MPWGVPTKFDAERKRVPGPPVEGTVHIPPLSFPTNSRLKALTVRVADPEMDVLETAVAVMVVVPVATGVAVPEALTVATLVFELDQVTVSVPVELSE
jgi:hypothetical protein